ncbi:MAG: NAD(+) synthase, partial [Actinomycetota bacterium]
VLADLAKKTTQTIAVIGFVEAGKAENELHNSAAVCQNGKVLGVYRKHLLPNYDVFDERRYFTPGTENPLFSIKGAQVGVTICEDIWSRSGPVAVQSTLGAVLNLNINGSPFHAGKIGERREMLGSRAREGECVVAYVNQVGGQDELVFDGGSMVLAADGTVVASAAQFVEELLICDLRLPKSKSAPAPQQARGEIAEPLGENAQIFSALVLGTRDYVHKNGFTDVVLGLSGGIDSALVAVIATQALGSEHVHGVAMPSRYSSAGSIFDASLLAKNLGIDLQTISIEPAFSAYLSALQESFSGRKPDLTDENLQSRVRGMTLMALSNKF